MIEYNEAVDIHMLAASEFVNRMQGDEDAALLKTKMFPKYLVVSNKSLTFAPVNVIYSLKY